MQHFGYKKANTTFYISDPYTLFYLKFIEHAGKYEPNIWLNKVDDPAFRSWSGIAFEQVCLAHIAPIKKALGIAGVASTTGVWYLKGDKHQRGGQIDLVVDRRDQVINLFEIKFSINKFGITKEYDAQLRQKIQRFKESTATSKSVFLTMLTTHGLVANEYRHSVVQNELTMDALFQ